MTNQHPITPPFELVKQWWKDAQVATYMDLPCWLTYVATQAARWGADQELEACCAIALVDPVCGTKHQRRMLVNHTREQRRPKPLSLKEQALEAVSRLDNEKWSAEMESELAVIHRALMALSDD